MMVLDKYLGITESIDSHWLTILNSESAPDVSGLTKI